MGNENKPGESKKVGKIGFQFLTDHFGSGFWFGCCAGGGTLGRWLIVVFYCLFVCMVAWFMVGGTDGRGLFWVFR